MVCALLNMNTLFIVLFEAPSKWPRLAETNRRHIINNYVFLRTTAYFVVFYFCDWAKKYKVICKDVNCNLSFVQ